MDAKNMKERLEKWLPLHRDVLSLEHKLTNSDKVEIKDGVLKIHIYIVENNSPSFSANQTLKRW